VNVGVGRQACFLAEKADDVVLAVAAQGGQIIQGVMLLQVLEHQGNDALNGFLPLGGGELPVENRKNLAQCRLGLNGGRHGGLEEIQVLEQGHELREVRAAAEGQPVRRGLPVSQEMNVVVLGLIAGQAALLAQAPVLDIVFALADFLEHAVLVEAQHAVVHHDQHILGKGALDMLFSGQKGAEGGAAVLRGTIQVQHHNHLLSSIAHLCDICKISANIPHCGLAAAMVKYRQKITGRVG